MNRKKSTKKKNKSPSNKLAKNIPKGLAQSPDPNKIITVHETSIRHTGPIPAPFVLADYEKICPGSADRIISMAENEQAHAHQTQKQGQEYDAKEVRTGQNYGLIIGIVAIVSGSTTAIMGAEWAGAFLGVGGVGGLISAFIYGRKKNNKPQKELQLKGK